MTNFHNILHATQFNVLLNKINLHMNTKAYVSLSNHHFEWDQGKLFLFMLLYIFLLTESVRKMHKRAKSCIANDSVWCNKRTYALTALEVHSRLHLLLKALFKNMPDSNNWGWEETCGGGITGANPTTEVNQTHNSFLTGALISLEPEAPFGNWAGRRGKTSSGELAATDQSYFHQTRQPPWHKADIAPRNKMIQEAFVYVDVWKWMSLCLHMYQG